MAATSVRRIVGEKRAAGEEILDFWALQRGLTEVDRGVSHSQLEVMIEGGGLGIRIPPPSNLWGKRNLKGGGSYTWGGWFQSDVT